MVHLAAFSLVSTMYLALACAQIPIPTCGVSTPGIYRIMNVETKKYITDLGFGPGRTLPLFRESTQYSQFWNVTQKRIGFGDFYVFQNNKTGYYIGQDRVADNQEVIANGTFNTYELSLQLDGCRIKLSQGREWVLGAKIPADAGPETRVQQLNRTETRGRQSWIFEKAT